MGTKRVALNDLTGVTDSKSGTWYLSCIYLRKCYAYHTEKIMMVWQNISLFSDLQQCSQKKALNTEFDVSYKKPLTRVTVILLTQRIVRLKTDLSLTV